MNRRSFLSTSVAASAAVIAGVATTSSVLAAANLQTIPLKDIGGKDTTLGDYKGKVLLIVNVASRCGYTRQYKGLEALFRKYKDKGLVVMGFPCNDFGAQEPEDEYGIQKFCKDKFDVTFPMFSKVGVKGEGKHPLYAALTGSDAAFPGEVKWNFGKFLVDRSGKVIARYDSKTEPDDAGLVAEIEKALGS
jgi:glutathione peroxidase